MVKFTWGKQKTIKNVEDSFNPGFQPKVIDKYDRFVWNDEYKKLTLDKKILLETQEQTRLIQRISKNILFWFWLTILGLIGYVYTILDVLGYI